MFTVIAGLLTALAIVLYAVVSIKHRRGRISETLYRSGSALAAVMLIVSLVIDPASPAALSWFMIGVLAMCAALDLGALAGIAAARRVYRTPKRTITP